MDYTLNYFDDADDSTAMVVFDGVKSTAAVAGKTAAAGVAGAGLTLATGWVGEKILKDKYPAKGSLARLGVDALIGTVAATAIAATVDDSAEIAAGVLLGAVAPSAVAWGQDVKARWAANADATAPDDPTADPTAV